jgi:hypothetical protein
LLVAVCLPVLAYLTGSGPREESDKIKQETINLQAQVAAAEAGAPTLLYGNSPAATQVAKVVSSRPSRQAVSGVINSLVAAGGRQIEVRFIGAKFIVAARSDRDISDQLNNSIGNISGVSGAEFSYRSGTLKIVVDGSAEIEESNGP